jgi:hypothetical protein
MPVAAWLSLLPYAEPEDLRSWLGEEGAALLARRLSAAGLPRRGFEHSPATWPIVAAVLAERLGHPDDVIEGNSAA